MLANKLGTHEKTHEIVDKVHKLIPGSIYGSHFLESLEENGTIECNNVICR